jgi:hypothetical protein
MANVLGTLVVALQAQTDSFARGMANAKTISLTTSEGIVSSLKMVETQMAKLRFGSAGEIKKSAEIVGASLAGIGIAATVAAVSFAKSTASEALELNKLHQSFGVSIEALSGLRVAAQMTGIPMESLAKGMGMLDKAAVGAVAGQKPLIQAFNQLGISVKDLSNGKGGMIDQVGLLILVADHFSKLTGGVLKAAEGRKLFGRGWAEIAPLMNQGVVAIQGYIDKAKALGLVMTAEDVAAALKFHETLTLVNVKMDAMKQTIGLAMIDPLNRLAKAFGEVDSAGNSTAAHLTGDLGDALIWLAKQIEQVITGTKVMYLELEHLSKFKEDHPVLSLVPGMQLAGWFSSRDQLNKDMDELYAKQEKFFASLEKPLPGMRVAHTPTVFGSNPPVLPSGTGAKPKPEDFSSLLTEATSIFDRTDPLQKQIDHVKELQLKIYEFTASHPEAIFLNLNDAAEKLNVALTRLAEEKSLALLGDQLKAGQEQIANLFAIPMGAPLASGAAKASSDEMNRLKDNNYIMEERARIFENTRTAMERYALDLQHINSLYADKSSDEYNRAIQDLDEKLRSQYDPTIRLKKALDDIALAYSLGAMNAAAMARAVAKVNADIAMANTVTHPAAGMAGVKQGIGAGAGAVGAEWQGMSAETANSMIQAAHQMQAAFATAFKSMIMGTKTVGQAFSEMGLDMLSSMVEACAQMLAKWIVTHVIMAAIAKAFGTDDGSSKAMTQIGSNVAIALSDAAVAAANTLAMTSTYLPPPGPEAAAAATYGVGLMFAGLAGADRGALLPRDALLRAHQGEAILPQKLTSYLMDSASRSQPQASAGGVRHIFNMPITINGATDAEEVSQKVVARVQKLFRTGGVMK